MKKWPAEQGYKTSNLESTNKNIGHFPSQGSDRFWSRPRQVIFLSHVTKNNRFVGKWSLMQVSAIKADDRFNEKRHTNYFYGFFVDYSDSAKSAGKPFIEPVKD